jgi:hypothetical protein
VHERPRYQDGTHRKHNPKSATRLCGDLGNPKLSDDRAHDRKCGETGQNQQCERALIVLGGAAANLVDATGDHQLVDQQEIQRDADVPTEQKLGRHAPVGHCQSERHRHAEGDGDQQPRVQSREADRHDGSRGNLVSHCWFPLRR